MTSQSLDYNLKKLARTPHTIFNLNILLIHLFGVIILFEMHLFNWFWLIPAISLSIMLLQRRHLKSLIQQSQSNPETHWYIVANWALTIKHNQIVFYGYLICGSIFLMGYTIANGMTQDPNMSNIAMIIFLYLSGNMMLLVLVVTFVLSSGAIWNSSKGEMTNSLVKIKERLKI